MKRIADLSLKAKEMLGFKVEASLTWIFAFALLTLLESALLLGQVIPLPVVRAVLFLLRCVARDSE